MRAQRQIEITDWSLAGAILLFLVAILLTFSPACCQNPADKGEWMELFNGKDLEGWTPKIRGQKVGVNYKDTFRVEEGVLKVSYDQYENFDEQFGHLFYEGEFSHYILRVEYRFVGNQVPGGPDWAFRNSGVMLHGQSPESMEIDQEFPVSIEAQFLGGRGEGTGERTTANLCTPGTNVEMNGKLFTTHCVNSTSKTYDGDQWVRVEVMVLGDQQVKHMIDGQTVLSYEKPQIGGGNVSGHDPAVKKDGMLLSEGYISLQSESHPIQFRKVEVLNLAGCMDPKATNFKSYYVKADNGQCVYGKKR